MQEVGAGEKGLVRFSARILESDVFIPTNVHEHHLNTYGSFENLLEDKLSIQDYMPKNGVIIANFDDPGTARAEFKRKVISVGIETKAQKVISLQSRFRAWTILKSQNSGMRASGVSRFLNRYRAAAYADWETGCLPEISRWKRLIWEARYPAS